MAEFSHIDEESVSMVDISEKADVRREATATGGIDLEPDTVEAIREGETTKGNVLSTARIAAIQAVKRTWDDIPLCHQIPITDVDVGFDLEPARVEATVTVRSTGKTGVEMEALNGVSRALLTVWDMVKAAEKDADGQYPSTAIGEIVVEEKVKGD